MQLNLTPTSHRTKRTHCCCTWCHCNSSNASWCCMFTLHCQLSDAQGWVHVVWVLDSIFLQQSCIFLIFCHSGTRTLVCCFFFLCFHKICNWYINVICHIWLKYCALWIEEPLVVLESYVTGITAKKHVAWPMVCWDWANVYNSTEAQFVVYNSHYPTWQIVKVI